MGGRGASAMGESGSLPAGGSGSSTPIRQGMPSGLRPLSTSSPPTSIMNSSWPDSSRAAAATSTP